MTNENVSTCFFRPGIPGNCPMKKYRRLTILLTFVLAIPLFAQTDSVVVRPAEIQDVLTNPGMGITTFQRFNGQALNPPLTWSESGPVTKLPQAIPPPDFPKASIAYCRWYWSVLEPE